MRASPQAPPHYIDLSRLAMVLKRRAGLLAVAAVVVGVLCYAALFLVPSRYASQAQIRIGSPSLGDSMRAPSAGPEAAALRADREAIASRVQELRSPDLAKQLAAELQLKQRPEFNDALEPQDLLGRILRMTGLTGPRSAENEQERVLAAYYRALQVHPVTDTVITLGFTAREGELAARAVNRLIELYQDRLRRQGVGETTDANAWLVPEIEKRIRELAAAEAEVERFRSSANLIRGGGSHPSSLAEQLSDLASELSRVRAQRSEAEVRARSARQLMSRDVPDAIPDVQKSPLIQGLIAQRVRAERDLAEASTRLLPAHPRMKQFNASVADIRRQLQREAATIVDGLQREAKALALREEAQSQALEETKARAGNKAGDRVRLAQLEDDAKAKRRELEGLRERYEAAHARGSTKAVPVAVQVVATALPSSHPSWPNRPQIAALAMAATFVLGLIVALFRELLAGAARRVPFAVPTERVASIAPAAAPTKAAAAGLPTERLLLPANDVRPRLFSAGAVVERLIGNSAGLGGYRTLVVGASDDVDVREEAADIAAGLSAAGRQVVLVDWSLDGEGISKGLGLAPSPGFTELIEGTASVEDVICALPDGDVRILPCGEARAMGAKGLHPDRVNLLLDALDAAYADVVITGTGAAARSLFHAIEGRVDAGIVVGSWMAADAARQFLGFEVTEMDVVHLDTVRPGNRPKRQSARRASRRLFVEAATPLS